MKGRILVVEDNLVTAEVIKHQLGKLGYTVAQVLTTGEEAVEWVLENDADLILMDVQLDGEIDGVEAASFIRHGSGSQKGSEVPIVYLTATSDLNTISRASVTRASGYLPKPFDQHALHGTIQMALAAAIPMPSLLKIATGSHTLSRRSLRRSSQSISRVP